MAKLFAIYQQPKDPAAFDSMAAIAAGLGSPQGQATAADLANFASAGVDIMMAETAKI